MKKCVFVFLLLLLCQLGTASAQQTGTIRGFVYERGSGEPLGYTMVILKGTTTGVQTDINGYFSIPQLKPGKYILYTTIIGYDTASVEIDIKGNDIITQKLFLEQKPISIEAFEVTASKTDKLTQVNVGVTTVTPREIKLLPSAGGEPDIAQYLQVMPGVVFTGDQGGQLYIRGGSPTQTGILLDGVTIYNPFHSIGLYSVFETDAIRNVDVQTAGFNAQYGNRTSAILDIRTKDGNKNRTSGKLSVSPIMARAMLEGPIRFKKRTEEQKQNQTSAVTYLLSYKTSYLESSSKALYGALGEPFKSGLPYAFNDLYGKITFSGENGSKLNLFGFNFDDKARVLHPTTAAEQASFNWKATGIGATFVVTPGNSAALISGRFAYSKYNIAATELNAADRTSGIEGFEGAIDFTNFLPGYSSIKYGMEVSGLHSTLDYVNAADVTVQLNRRNTMAAFFAVFRKNFNEKLILEPSVRIQYYSAINTISPEPRLGLKYNATQNIRLKAGTGIYSQNIISTKSDRDIVNFFNGFLLSPDAGVRDQNGNIVKNSLQRAYHFVAGIEVDAFGVEFNLEPWYKKFSRNIELNRVKKSAEDGDFASGVGDAYGIDLSAKYTKNRFFFWGVVSVAQMLYQTQVASSVTAEPETQSYAPPFDRRFNLNLVGSYSAGKNNVWDFSIRYNVGSPFPFTQTQGFYENLNLGAGGLSTNYLTQNGQLELLYANELNQGRLSWYHRLDLSVKRRFDLGRYSNIETMFSLTNAYNRNNIFFIQRTENVRIYQLPIFPSLSLNWNF